LPYASLDSRFERRQLQPVAAVQWKLPDLSFADEAAEARVHAHLRSVRADRHLLPDLPEHEVEVDGHRSANGDGDATADRGLKASGDGLHVIITRRNAEHLTGSRAVRERRPHGAGLEAV